MRTDTIDPNNLKDKGTSVPGALKEKLKTGKEVADKVAKKVAEGTNPNDPNGGASGSSGSSNFKWIKEVLETSTIWIGDMLGRAAAWVITSVLAIVFGLGSPNLGADYIYTWTGRTFSVAIPITITLAFWQLTRSAIQARGLSGVRRAAGGSVVATGASMVTLPILVALTTGVDELRAAMVSWLGLDVEALSKQITDIFSSDTFLALAGVSPGSAATAAAAMMFGFGIFCLLVLFFAIALLFVMVLRNLYLQAAAVVTPVAYSGLAADETRSWPRTVLGWLMALLFAPFGIVIVLGIGFLGLSEIDKADSITEALSQMATCAAAMLGGLACPGVFFKLFSFLGEDAVSSMIAQMRGAVVAGATTVGNTVKSVVNAASSPTEDGPIGQTVKSAADQAAYGDTDGTGEQQGQDGGEGQGAGDQQGQDGGEGQKAKVAAAAAAVATGGASAAAGAGAGAAGSSGGAAASSSGAGSGSAAGGASGSTSTASGGSGGGSVGSVAGAPAEGGGTTAGGGATGGSVTSTGGVSGSGGGGLSPAPTPSPGISAGSGGGSVGSVAGAPAPAPVGGGAFAGAEGAGGDGFAAVPGPAPSPTGGSFVGSGGGSVGSVAGAPPAGYGYNQAPPPPPTTSYSSSSLYGYNSPGGSGYGGYGSDYQGHRSTSSAGADTEVFAAVDVADEPVGIDPFEPDEAGYWEEV
ncbi:hypothetical protein BKH13_12825 [Actinomyces naeslundii]|uniref:TrbL/VirB6 plasmid conjugal transfer protein n=1 Tax=Actinomyces naeslundii TaxID=1655 RepID=A0ABX3EVP3_ACTNA|nr:hypothetical protein BKH13_12825 [Actinomyces naeslundii]